MHIVSLMQMGVKQHEGMAEAVADVKRVLQEAVSSSAQKAMHSVMDRAETADRSLLERVGLPTGAIRNILMHRDIVPRSFACDYKLVADLLARVNDGFREHGCLQNTSGRQVSPSTFLAAVSGEHKRSCKMLREVHVGFQLHQTAYKCLQDPLSGACAPAGHVLLPGQDVCAAA